MVVTRTCCHPSVGSATSLAGRDSSLRGAYAKALEEYSQWPAASSFIARSDSFVLTLAGGGSLVNAVRHQPRSRHLPACIERHI